MFDFHPHGTPTASIAIESADVELDTALLALREPLLEAWRAEAAEWAIVNADDDIPWDRAEAANARTGDVAGRIEALPATTLAGLQVKALALSWTHHGNAMGADDGSSWERTRDMRLAAQIISTLVDMAGGQDGGMPAIAGLYEPACADA